MADYRYSNLTAYADCPLRFRLQEELHLQPIQADQHHLHYGIAFHAGLSKWYSGSTLKESQQAFLNRYPIQIDTTDLAKTRPHGEFTLEKYTEQYADDFKRWEILSNEQTDLMDDGYGVTLDLVVRDRATDQIFGVDHKTTGAYLNYDYWGKFEPNSQITQYVKFIKERYGYCDGFIINAVSFRFRQRASKDGPAGYWCKFERQIFQRNPTQIEQDTISRDDWIKNIERSRDVGVWRMNTNACRFCSFKSVCGAGWTWDEDSELILQSFRQVCGFKMVGGERCSLDLGHTEPHRFDFPVDKNAEFLIAV